MEFKLNFEIPKPGFSIQHGDSGLFLGSCFSDEMAAKLHFHGLKVASNPFGTVFHPSLLCGFIKQSLTVNEGERILKRDDLFLSWDANSTVFDFSSAELVKRLKELRVIFADEIKHAKILFVTFGTAWAYRRKEDLQLVANCHKIPNDQFTKELISIDEMYQEWIETVQLLKDLNPEIQVVFTVSPVRHIRDGLIENNQSKAVLTELVRRLINETDSYYFPSYEIIIDELRDYRFFKSDRVHPTEEAVEYVWKRFEATFCNEATILLNKKVANFRRTAEHRSIHEGSQENRSHKIKMEDQLAQFLKENSKVIF